jgi:hypothetical protein
MIHRIKHYALRVRILQKRFAKRVKRRERNSFPALSRGFHHARFHFPRGFFRERQRQNVFAGDAFLRIKQVANALGNDSRLSRTSACDDQQRPFAMRDRAPLRIVQL